LVKIIKFSDAPQEKIPGLRTIIRFFGDKKYAKNIGVMLIDFEPNVNSGGVHYHEKRESAYIVIEGSATFLLNEVEYELEPETFVFIEPGDKHGIIATGESGFKMIEVYSPLAPDRIDL
jgi:quercetin dioxygenase-like cupin family protein